MKKSLFHPMIVFAMLMVVAIIGCTPQPALAGDSIACHQSAEVDGLAAQPASLHTVIAALDSPGGIAFVPATGFQSVGITSGSAVTFETASLKSFTPLPGNYLAHIGTGYRASTNVRSMQPFSSWTRIPDH